MKFNKSFVKLFLFCLLGGLWCVAAGGLDFYRASVILSKIKQHDKNSQFAQGTVLQSPWSWAALFSATPKHGWYRVHYRFTTPEGQVVEGADWVSRRGSYPPGSPIRISYLPADLNSNRIYEKGEWLDLGIQGVWGGVVFLLGGFLLFTFYEALDAERISSRAAARAGVVELRGTVVGVTEKEKGGPKIIHFTFKDRHGQTHHGEHELVPEVRDAWKVGDTGLVYFDPQRPEDSYWIGE